MNSTGEESATSDSESKSTEHSSDRNQEFNIGEEESQDESSKLDSSSECSSTEGKRVKKLRKDAILRSGRASRRLITQKGDWRFQGHYNDKYREVFNADVNDIKLGVRQGCQSQLVDSQIGVRHWSVNEKDSYFNAVARFGRDNLPKISQVIAISIPEIHQYQQLLENGLKELSVNNRHDFLPGPHEIPAATDVSNDCCEQLEIVASSLALHQINAEAREEMEEYGKWWLIDRDVARLCDEAISETNEVHEPEPPEEHVSRESSTPASSQDMLQKVPSAKLLNATKMLDLSEQLFMNYEDKDRNWQTYTEDNGGVAMFRSAFDELHTLIVSITRRIMHTAHFQAMSRLRATYKPKWKQKRVKVTHTDVESAVDLLGLRVDSHEYWASLPRRFGFTCLYQKDCRSASKRYEVRYERAELYLREPIEKSRSVKGVEAELMGGQDVARNLVTLKNHYQERSEVDDSSESRAWRMTSILSRTHSDNSGSDFEPESSSSPDTEESDSEGSFSSSDSSHQSEATRRLPSTNEDGVDDYLDALDCEASKDEERKMWRLLEIKPPNHLDLQPNNIPNSAPRKQLHGGPQRNWRDFTRYRPEWENRPPIFNIRDVQPVRKRKRRTSESTSRSRSRSMIGLKRVRTRSASRTKSAARDSRLENDEMDETDDVEGEPATGSEVSMRRQSLPRRASQAALQSSKQSLSERMEMDDLSGEEYDPRSDT